VFVGRVDCPSEVLQRKTGLTLVLPQQTPSRLDCIEAQPATFPVLFLLHGLHGNHTEWLEKTRIVDYAGDRGIAVVMPDGGKSFYADEAHGDSYWTYLTTELPTVLRRWVRWSGLPSDTYVAGNSMGGYGAFKWALRHPDRFAAAASLSGSLDLAGRIDRPGGFDLKLWDTIFDGKPITDTPNDLLWLLREGGSHPGLPRLWVGCGHTDDLRGESERFVDAAIRHGVTPTLDFGPGDHTWPYWDQAIKRVIDWLPLRRPTVPR